MFTFNLLTYAGAGASGDDKELREMARLDVIATTMATEFFLRDELLGKPGKYSAVPG